MEACIRDISGKNMGYPAEIWAKIQLPERSPGCKNFNRGGVAKW